LTLAFIDRVIRGETKLHRRLRREFLLAVVVVSAVVIYRTLCASPGNENPLEAPSSAEAWSGPAIPGNPVQGPQIGAFPIPGLRYFPDRSD
jgi:hypothetical protein